MAGAGELPTFLIVGAMKSGTTALAAHLREHPEAFVPEVKEVEFFDHDGNLARGIEWYRAQFAGADGEVAVGEASPSYMCHPDGPRRMAAALPEAKLIVLLRDPAERAYSHYWHWRSRKGLEPRSFAEAVAAELALAPPWETGRWQPEQHDGFHYLARGRYLPQIERLLEHYPRAALHVAFHEDLERDPRGTFAAICRFLGIDDGYVPEGLGRRYNSHYGFRREKLWALLVRLEIGRRLPARIARGLFLTMRDHADYPPMDPGVRERLAAHFAADNEALGRWLGRDLSHWGRDDATDA